MVDDFNLSKERRCLSNRFCYLEKDVKEFVKLLNIELCAMLEGEILLKKKDIKRVYAIIDKLAGKKLL